MSTKTPEQMKQDYLACVSILSKLYNNNLDKAIKWMKTENKYFNNQTPSNIVYSGEGRKIVLILTNKLIKVMQFKNTKKEKK